MEYEYSISEIPTQILRRLFLPDVVKIPWKTSGIPAEFRLVSQKNPTQYSGSYFGNEILVLSRQQNIKKVQIERIA
jgi:hypothetical protein